MGADSTDKRTAVAMVGAELARRGWKLWGWKEDRSDSMTDYWDPESWDGVASRGNLVVCVDVSDRDVERQSGKPDQRHVYLDGPCSPCSGTGKQLRDYDSPGSRMQNLLTGHVTVQPPEHYAAGSPCRFCKGTGCRKESRQIPDAPVWPVFHACRKGTTWHVERAGQVIPGASGTGVFAVARERYQGGHDWQPADARPLQEVTCSRCGKAGVAEELHREDCPEARPKLRALVDRIEAAARRASATIEAPRNGAGPEVSPGKRPGFLEVRFGERPADDVLAALKAGGYRWNPRDRCWWGPEEQLPAGVRS